MTPSRDRSPVPVDWAAIKERVEAAGRMLSMTNATRPDRVQAVLEERARALALPVAVDAPADSVELMTFALANERYAVESRQVHEVFRLEALSALPGAKPPTCGVTARRGELLTILDLRPSLGLSAGALNDLSCVIVLGDDRIRRGVLADAVLGIESLPTAAIRTPPAGIAAQRDYVRGMTPGAVLVLEVHRLLTEGA